MREINKNGIVKTRSPRKKSQPTNVVRRSQRPTYKPATGPTQEEIQLRAFQIYEARGRAPSHDLEDWVQAERELRNDG